MQILPPRFEADREREYRTRELEQSVRYHRVAAPIGAVLYIAYLGRDLALSPDTAGIAFRIRILGVGVLAFFFGATYAEAYRRNVHTLTGLLTLFFGISAALILYLNPRGFPTNGVAGILIVFMLCATAFRLTPVAAFASSLATTITANFLMEVAGLDLSLVIANDVHLAAGTIVATVHAWLSELHARRAFELDWELRAERAATEALSEGLRAEKDMRIGWLENLTRFLRHELKNQLLGVRSSVELAERIARAPETVTDLNGRPNSQLRVYLERASRSTTLKQRLLNAAAEASSVEAAVATDATEVVDHATVAQGRAAEFQEFADRRFRVSANGPLAVRGNEARLVQMLDKLLANACDHSPDGSEVTVRTQSSGQHAVVEIANEGTLPEDRERIFALFHTEQRPGSDNLGLGLYVAKLIVEAHDGRIRAEDGDGRVRFFVEIPLIDPS